MPFPYAPARAQQFREPEWDQERDAPPFRWRRARLGRQAGSRDLGASLFEVPPGGATFPLHIHYANEELLFVLAGRPTLRTLEGDRELDEGEVVALPAGRSGAHAVDNLSRRDRPVPHREHDARGPEINEFPERGDSSGCATSCPAQFTDDALDVDGLRPT